MQEIWLIIKKNFTLKLMLLLLVCALITPLFFVNRFKIIATKISEAYGNLQAYSQVETRFNVITKQYREQYPQLASDLEASFPNEKQVIQILESLEAKSRAAGLEILISLQQRDDKVKNLIPYKATFTETTGTVGLMKFLQILNDIPAFSEVRIINSDFTPATEKDSATTKHEVGFYLVTR